MVYHRVFLDHPALSVKGCHQQPHGAPRRPRSRHASAKSGQGGLDFKLSAKPYIRSCWSPAHLPLDVLYTFVGRPRRQYHTSGFAPGVRPEQLQGLEPANRLSLQGTVSRLAQDGPHQRWLTF